MSQSNIKKNRKEIRRQVNNKIGEGIAAFAEIVRPRPKWIPKRVWILAYLPLFPRKYARMFYKHMK